GSGEPLHVQAPGGCARGPEFAHVTAWRLLPLLLARLPLVPFATPGSRQLAARIAAALSEPPEPHPGAVLLERHGAIAVGATIDQALDRMELVDVLCRVWRDALLIRAARART
ncbi:MAG: class II aldolase/adducin family protein, partial [Chloroflexi bacterium]|nr:class II aldolase/adducin family protein [Chloroflexota bacterium]